MYAIVIDEWLTRKVTTTPMIVSGLFDTGMCVLSGIADCCDNDVAISDRL